MGLRPDYKYLSFGLYVCTCLSSPMRRVSRGTTDNCQQRISFYLCQPSLFRTITKQDPHNKNNRYNGEFSRLYHLYTAQYIPEPPTTRSRNVSETATPRNINTTNVFCLVPLIVCWAPVATRPSTSVIWFSFLNSQQHLKTGQDGLLTNKNSWINSSLTKIMTLWIHHSVGSNQVYVKVS